MGQTGAKPRRQRPPDPRGRRTASQEPLLTRCRSTPGSARGTRRRAAGLERRAPTAWERPLGQVVVLRGLC